MVFDRARPKATDKDHRLWYVCVCVCVCVCLSVCLSASISFEPHARFLPNLLCMLPIAVARFSSGGVTKSRGEGVIVGFSTPLTMHCTA